MPIIIALALAIGGFIPWWTAAVVTVVFAVIWFLVETFTANVDLGGTA